MNQNVLLRQKLQSEIDKTRDLHVVVAVLKDELRSTQFRLWEQTHCPCKPPPDHIYDWILRLQRRDMDALQYRIIQLEKENAQLKQNEKR
jgi:hypothetical protein